VDHDALSILEHDTAWAGSNSACRLGAPDVVAIALVSAHFPLVAFNGAAIRFLVLALAFAFAFALIVILLLAALAGPRRAHSGHWIHHNCTGDDQSGDAIR
jgi:hypothetical protein